MFAKSLPEPLMDFLRRRFILIADDNRDLAISLSMLLKLVGFDVQTVHTGGEAVTAAKSRRPDVLLLDIGLPGLDGYQVARQFRSDDTLKDVFIIAVSGYSPDMFQGRSTPGDFDHYFTKPVDFPTLLSLIHKAG
jgi:two-component system OmpR family response regulator